MITLRLPYFIVKPLMRWAMRYARTHEYHSIIGPVYNPMMIKWRLLSLFGWKLNLHKICRPDNDTWHNHVSWSASLILSTGYIEHEAISDGYTIQELEHIREPGDLIFRSSKVFHKIENFTSETGDLDQYIETAPKGSLNREDIDAYLNSPMIVYEPSYSLFLCRSTGTKDWGYLTKSGVYSSYKHYLPNRS